MKPNKKRMARKEANFIRIAERRTTKAMVAIRLIGNLANTSNYSYSKGQVNQITAALQEEAGKLGKRLNDSLIDPGERFKFTF